MSPEVKTAGFVLELPGPLPLCSVVAIILAIVLAHVIGIGFT